MVIARFIDGIRFAALSVLLWIAAVPDALAEPMDGPRVLGGIESVPATLVADQILREAYGRLDIPVKIQYLPSKRVRYLSRLGRLDGDLFRVRSMQDEYTRMVRVPAPLLTGYIHCAVGNPDDLHLCDNPSEVKGMVAMLKSVRVAEDYVQELGGKTLRVERYRQIADLLRHGRVKLGLVSSIEGIAPFDWPNWENVVIRDKPLREFTLYHYIHSRYREDVDRLASVLGKMRESGWTEQVISRFIRKHGVRMLVYRDPNGPAGE